MWSTMQAAPLQSTEGKLVQLRAKTDRDLAALLGNLVEHGCNALARDDYAQAEAAYAEAAKLLPLAQDRSAHDSGALRTRLAELRAELDKVACPCRE